MIYLLERLSSPEELDQLMQVTTPKGWLALLGLAGLIVVVLIWGIFGNIPTKVAGEGILLKPFASEDAHSALFERH